MKYLIFFLIIATNAMAQEQVTSEDVRVAAELFGTLRIPQNSDVDDLVIIIAGSGPTDRNGNKQMMRNNAYLKLSKALNEQGIATFSYDKRILSQLRNGRFIEEDVRLEQFIEDAVTVIEYFKERRIFSNIYVVGHSQGSLVGMVAVQKTDVAGFISIAGAAQSIDETILNQIELQMPDLKEEAATAFAELKEKGKVKKFSGALTSILRPSIQPFMYSWMQYNPRREIRKLKVPTLIINGTQDLQIDTKQAEILHKAKPDASLQLIDNMNHVLVLVEGDDLDNSKTYNNPNLPIAQELVHQITQFIKS